MRNGLGCASFSQQGLGRNLKNRESKSYLALADNPDSLKIQQDTTAAGVRDRDSVL
jgi:hypothetical protein